ncbi:tRNA (adenosine(37)-N6)-threonylcarbamoyltransferase complex ATPase subunit type 1 TsaE [Sulfurimonas sp. SWIR-19]|uniref:tRNA (adenosine(37)-N6)-threonylcarbamoyltransferase complex ATPase subunit type 1 TsaE n=1 Tax=Sulfurimonas sp. SWIR-19 TaxID=2878390 RepID=UPI001CF3A4CB|nr:tRNA (adenosine(37)-N6)-threonylcarbamoyltransferase complex ATPase subunit type 1 TsaE [Sulfurimonas sp. SWIR-19]UCM99268.1 tRNA (adenosine(37)-N6)-threonylcarbamoyltransferase complex ATPase subunit type 1 TsaE [Sulfurimonas sp. SWIR-19]
MKKTYTYRLEELDSLADRVISQLQEGVIILKGDLAAGKTTLVKNIAKKLGWSEDVTSPTFSLQQCYGEKLFHYDIYNHGLDHFISLGMLEELEKPGLHFIEWGSDELVDILVSAGIETVIIEIEKISDDAREYTICTH